MKFLSRCGWLLSVWAVAACQPSSPSPTGAGPHESAADTQRAEAPSAMGTVEELRQRAAQAMREQRVYAPAGDNAAEYFLAARRQRPDDADVQGALVELQPYLLIAAEQALERADIAESGRLLALIAQVDANAPALPRLRLAMREAQERKAHEAKQKAGATELATHVPSTLSQPAPPGASAAANASTASALVASAQPESLPAAPAPIVAAPRTAEAAPAPAAAAAVASAATPPPRATAVRTPRLLQDAPPRYPLPALRGKVEGQAEVAFTIQPDGSVRNVHLVSSSPAGVFDDSAVAVASRWRFEATGQTHASRRTVLFRLPN